MEKRHFDSIFSRLIPPPHEFSADYGVWKIADGALVELHSPDPAAEGAVHAFFAKYAQADVKIVRDDSAVTLPPEGYRLEVTPEKCVITAANALTAGYALKSVRQLMESERGVQCSMRKQVPCVRIADAPELAFRGIHLCWFPETPVWEIERQIRLAAYYKFNYAVIESWGVLQFESHPEFCWDEYAVPKDEFRRLIKLGKSLGIRLVPQLNLFGHASCSRCGTGKHVLLERHPEYEPLFEPAGWTWCVSNPATRQYLTDLVEELLDLYDAPPFFHIGCDEAYTPESCSLCMHDYLNKLAGHITYFHDLIAGHGARAMMWHDMLVCRDDPRWHKLYTACGSLASGHDKLAGMLPKSMILCDWQYHYPEIDGQPPQWPISKYLRDLGFPVAVCPWDDPRGGLSLGKMAVKENLFGFLQTVWHHGKASHLLDNIFTQGAHAAWSPSVPSSAEHASREQMNHHIRQLNFEMGLKEYRQLGDIAHQVDPAPFQD